MQPGRQLQTVHDAVQQAVHQRAAWPHSARLPLAAFGAAALLFVLAFGVRLALWFHGSVSKPFEGTEVVRTAVSFAKYNVLGNPYILPTGPSAHVTPAFPFLLGLIYKLVPDPNTAETVKNLFTIAISSLQYALLPFLAVVARIPWRAGMVAGCLGALIPFQYLESSGNYEAPLIGLTLVAVCIFRLTLAQSDPVSPHKALLIGVVWGLTTLVSAQIAMVGFVYEIVINLIERISVASRAVRLGTVWLGMGLAVLPWTIRNYVELGAPVISRSNAGLELYISNSDIATPLLDENIRRGIQRQEHPNSNQVEASLIRRIGEVRYNKLKRAEAIAWIRTHPRQFLWLTWKRFCAFWVGEGGSKVAQLYCILFLLLAIPGLFVLWRLNAPGATVMMVALIVYPLPHYVVQTGLRYRYPLNSAFLLLSAVTIWQLAIRFSLIQASAHPRHILRRILSRRASVVVRSGAGDDGPDALR